jgi:CHAT domain-containing protein
VYTPSAFPQQWAMTQNNLGLAYRDRILGEKAENVEKAIAAYSAALEVYTRSAFPQDWAMTQNNLGAAYSDRILGEKAENVENAIAAYSAALEVYTRSAFPQDWAETLFNLGTLYQNEKKFDLAYKTFADAIPTVESLRGRIISGDESKRKQAEEWNKLYVRMVQVCLALGKKTEAIEYIERSKTRNLVELLTKAASTNQDTILDHIKFSEITNLVADNTAIIQWYIFNDCFRAFIITHSHPEPVIWSSQPQDLQDLANFASDYLKLFDQDRYRWKHELSNKLTQLTNILHLNDIISHVPTHCQRLVLIPHRYLHLFPLHAIPLSTSNSSPAEYLFDRFTGGVSYTPSCQLLRLTKLKAEQLGVGLNQLSHLFAIQNPSQDLRFTDIEVETIAAKFETREILKHNAATKEAVLAKLQPSQNLQNYQWLHFSCHGYFDFQFPLKSALQLADAETTPNTQLSRNIQIDKNTTLNLDKCLTLEDIFQLNLPKCRLVTLSACQTGLIDIGNNSDEYIGLSSGFLKAGAANIISTLWSVDDFHTAVLMIRFYQTLVECSGNVSLALNKAQQWLRLATQAEIISWIKSMDHIEPSDQEKIKEIIKQLEGNYQPQEKPFTRPLYWAGFCAISPC